MLEVKFTETGTDHYPKPYLGGVEAAYLHLVRIIAFHIVIIKVKVILRPTVSRPVRLGVMHPSGTSDQFFFLLEIFFKQLGV
jgi:hypothetical protein